MAVTALKVENPTGEVIRVKFMTNRFEAPAKDGNGTKVFLNIEVQHCNEEFVPQGTTSKTVHDKDEEEYHRELRIAASEEGHYVPEESTDPEWNPIPPANGEDTNQITV